MSKSKKPSPGAAEAALPPATCSADERATAFASLAVRHGLKLEKYEEALGSIRMMTADPKLRDAAKDGGKPQ
jgi:hypothetical protein